MRLLATAVTLAGVLASSLGATAASAAPVTHVASVASVVRTVAKTVSTVVGNNDQSQNPLAQRPFYVDPNTWANWATTQYPADAADLSVIANTAESRWFGDWTPTTSIAAAVDSYVSAAAATNTMPVLTLYAIPNRDCGSYSAGGFATGAQYSAWISQVVIGIGNRPAAVILEPDALTSADCLSYAGQLDRVALLKDAAVQLTVSSNTALYLDGGHSRWLSPSDLAYRLQLIGNTRVRGFSLNTSNFFTTDEEIAYGEQVSAILGGYHYIIDTSRNGVGPAADAPLNWCNPTGRAIGAFPTAVTAGDHADAYLWIKHPGESDGECERSEPASGTWFNSYAVGLVETARLSGANLN